MWMKKLYATFGKLDGKTLELSPGLNIIYGKNEAGKSTWTAFIKAMFYGISTREQKKAGFIPDKEKYIPWNGSAMYGKIELSTPSGDMTLEAMPAKARASLKVTSSYDESGREAPFGEELIGVSASVYERTAFIRQAQIEVSGDSETERRILSIASSGDETVSAGEVIARLKKKQRELGGTGKNAVIQRLEGEIRALREKIEQAEITEAEISQSSESIKAYKAAKQRFERSLSVARAEEEKNKSKYVENARKELSAALLRVSELEKFPTRRELDDFIQKKSEWSSLNILDEQKEKQLSGTEDELRQCRRELSESPFCGMGEKDVETVAEEASAVFAQGEYSKKASAVPAYALFAAGVIFAAATVFSAFFAVAAALAVLAGVTYLVLSKKNAKKSKTVEELKKKYNISGSEELSKKVLRYSELFSREKELSERKMTLEAERKESLSAIEALSANMKNLMLQFLPGEESFDLAGQKLRKMVEEREEAQIALRAAHARVEALDAAGEVSEEKLEYAAEEIPDEPPEYFEAELSEISEKIRIFEIHLAGETAKLAGFSRSSAEKELSELLEKLSKASFEHDALSLAIDVMDQTETELKNRFSPKIEKRTAELFSYLTGGSFEFVRIKSSDFDFDVAKGEATSPRDGLMLSRGTLDELYFALRIALFETIIPEDFSPPMILDDALVNFDDERMERALSLLLEIAEKRQVVLMSCHRREAELLKANPKVRITEI